jgi:PhnB protein
LIGNENPLRKTNRNWRYSNPQIWQTSSNTSRTKEIVAMAVRDIPLSAGGLGVTIAVPDAEEAGGFYRCAFDAEEIARYLVPGHPSGAGPVKAVHLRIGAVVMNVSTANPRDAATMDKWGAKTPAMLKGFSTVFTLYVDDVDAALARATEAGARRVSGPEDTLWGDRVAVIEDPFGYPWGPGQRDRGDHGRGTQPPLGRVGGEEREDERAVSRTRVGAVRRVRSFG